MHKRAQLAKRVKSPNQLNTVNVEEFSVHRVPPMPHIQNRKTFTSFTNPVFIGRWSEFQVLPAPFTEFCSETRERAQSLCTPGFSVFWAASNKVDNFSSILSPPGTTTNASKSAKAAGLPTQALLGFWESRHFLFRDFQDFS